MSGCGDCGTTRANVVLPHGRLCRGCRLRRHHHPRTCPGCGTVRPLAYRPPGTTDDADGTDVCATCAGAVSVFACTDCGSEEHPYGYTRCARCYLTELVTSLLTDPATGRLHPRLVPLHQALTTGRRPQTTYWWLTRPGQVAQDVLSGLASGRLPISHDTFRQQLPMDRRHGYLRDLLVSTGILTPYAPAIERIDPWLAAILAAQPAPHAEVLNRFARWHVLRQLRAHDRAGTLTSAVVNMGRAHINAAVRLLDWAHARGTTIDALTQADLEDYLLVHPGARYSARAFLLWLGTSQTNTALTLPRRRQQLPEVTMTDRARWASVELLLHDATIASQSRVAGLFLLLFAQPLNKITQMTRDQIHHAQGRVTVTFDTVPIELPPVVAAVVLDHMNGHGSASYRLGDIEWLFPGRLPGRPIATETVRKILVHHDIHPRASRSAALYALAGQIPAPVLADLLGITRNNATQWAQLAARDWTNYVATRPSRRG